MSQNTGHTRVCPTRIDGATALFTHKVTVPHCQDRQRGRYHKCFTCSYNNGFVAAKGPRPSAAPKRVGKKASVKELTKAAIKASDPVDAAEGPSAEPPSSGSSSGPSSGAPGGGASSPRGDVAGENLIGPLPAPA